MERDSNHLARFDFTFLHRFFLYIYIYISALLLAKEAWKRRRKVCLVVSFIPVARYLRDWVGAISLYSSVALLRRFCVPSLAPEHRLPAQPLLPTPCAYVIERVRESIRTGGISETKIPILSQRRGICMEFDWLRGFFFFFSQKKILFVIL